MKSTRNELRLPKRLLAALLCVLMAAGCLSGLAEEEIQHTYGMRFSDDVHTAGDAQTVLFTDGLALTADGRDGGIGVDILSHNDPVSVVLSENEILVLDQSETGFEAMGVYASAVSGGFVSLDLSADVFVTAESQLGDAAAYGVFVDVNDEALILRYFVDEQNVIHPLKASKYNQVSSFTAVRSGEDVTAEYEDLRALFIPDGEACDLYLLREDGSIAAWSKGLPALTADTFLSYVSGPYTVIQGPVDVTLYTSEDDPGTPVTIDKGGQKMIAYYDDWNNYYVTADGSVMIDPFTKARYSVEMFDEPQAEARIGSRVYAEGTDAVGLYLKASSGPVRAELLPGTSIHSVGQVAAGLYLRAIQPMELVGSDVEIVARGTDGDQSEAIGFWLQDLSFCSARLTGDNHISVSTQGTPYDYAAGILITTMAEGVGQVYYEGTVDAAGTGMIGVQVVSMQGGNGIITIIGDVNLTDSDRDGLYVQLQGAMPMLGWVPQGEIYVRGNVTLMNAIADAAGINAIGGTVILDGDLSVSGSGEAYGIYADESATVLVTGEITAPIAVGIPGDTDTITNNSSVYLWKAADTVEGKAERIGFVLKMEDGVDAVLESDSASFVALKRDGRIYYGAMAGDAVTVKTVREDLTARDAFGNDVMLEKIEGGYSFTVPANGGVLLTVFTAGTD